MEFKSPVYDVKAIPIEKIEANDYNPNYVAKREMALLYQSIKSDGYTMPIVCFYDDDNDKYIIVDIMMPETYVLAAESLLKTKAQEYLDKNSRERFQYAVVSDPFYFEAQNVNIPLGSTVHFIDSDFALDDDLRVIGKKTTVQDRYSVELELSEETQVSSIVKSYYEQQKTQNTKTYISIF